jgi:hypothetical protein
MNKIYFFIFYFISISILAQDEVSADWSVSIDGDEVTISIVEFNNFTVGLDGHWHYILNDEDYVAVHDINDVILSNLPDGDHSLFIWLVDHMHNALNPPVEEIIEFSINTELSNSENEILDMMIYPNPVDGNYVTILSTAQGLKEIEVYSVTGRKVIDTAINGSTLDVSSLNTGFYLLKVKINGQNKVSKLVIR